MPSLIIQKKIIHIFRVSVVIRNEHFLGFLKRSPLKNPPQFRVIIFVLNGNHLVMMQGRESDIQTAHVRASHDAVYGRLDATSNSRG